LSISLAARTTQITNEFIPLVAGQCGHAALMAIQKRDSDSQNW